MRFSFDYFWHNAKIMKKIDENRLISIGIEERLLLNQLVSQYLKQSVPPIWIYTPLDAPFYLVKSKVYVDMDYLFLFQFCLCDLFVKNEDALGQFQLARSFHIHD